MKPHLRIKSQQGHMDIGYTVASWIIVIGVFALFHYSDGKPLTMWLAWPWWAEGLSVIAPVIIFMLGGAFERANQWPKYDNNHVEENEKAENEQKDSKK